MICDRCRREMRFDWGIKKRLWLSVSDNPKDILCIECFIQQATEKDIKLDAKDFDFELIYQDVE